MIFEDPNTIVTNSVVAKAFGFGPEGRKFDPGRRHYHFEHLILDRLADPALKFLSLADAGSAS